MMILNQFLFKILVLLSLLMCSCGQKEELTPAFKLKKSTQQTYRFNISRQDAIDSPTSEFSQIGPVGGVVQNLADSIAQLVLSEDETTVPMDKMTFYFPEIKEVDLDIVDQVELERVLVRLASSDKQKDLKFIKKIDVYLEYGHELADDHALIDQQDESDRDEDQSAASSSFERTLGGDIPESAEKVLSYHRSQDSLLCRSTCLDFEVLPISFQKIVDYRFTSYTVHIRLVIDGMPKGNIELETDFSIRVDADLFR